MYFIILSIFLNLHAASAWKAEAVTGKAEAIDVLEYSKPIFTIKSGMEIPQSFLVEMQEEKTSLVLKNKDLVRVAFKGPAMFGLGQYKNMTADIIVVKGEAEVVLPPKSAIFKIETSSIGVELEGGSSAIVRSTEKGENYEAYICVTSGSGFIKDVFSKPIQKAAAGQSFSIWKGRVIEKGTCPFVKVEIPKPVEKVVKLKKPVPVPEKPKKPKTEDEEFDLGEIQRELFGKEVTTDEELRKQLLKGEKKDIIEKEKCVECAEDTACVAFMLPEGFNVVAPSVYPDKTLPALIYQLNAKGEFGSKLADVKLVKKDDGRYFEYMLKPGTYGVSVVKGPVFKIELKEKQRQKINISAFINPGYRIEMESSTKELVLSFEDKTMPIFVYPGTYNFKLFKGEKPSTLMLIIKPGSVLFIEQK